MWEVQHHTIIDYRGGAVLRHNKFAVFLPCILTTTLRAHHYNGPQPTHYDTDPSMSIREDVMIPLGASFYDPDASGSLSVFKQC